MEKTENSKKLNEVQHELTNATVKLDGVFSQVEWSELIYPDCDRSVEILQQLNQAINDLKTIQRNLLIKPKGNK